MPMWNKTGAQLLEKRNSFLRDLAHGLQVVYSVVEDVGGTFDPISDTVVGGSKSTVSTDFGKAAILAPLKDLREEGDDLKSKMVVGGGRKMTGVDVSTSILVRMHIKVPLNFEATYTLGGQTYVLSKIVSNVAIGGLPCWNEVLLVKS